MVSNNGCMGVCEKICFHYPEMRKNSAVIMREWVYIEKMYFITLDVEGIKGSDEIFFSVYPYGENIK